MLSKLSAQNEHSSTDVLLGRFSSIDKLLMLLSMVSDISISATFPAMHFSQAEAVSSDIIRRTLTFYCTVNLQLLTDLGQSYACRYFASTIVLAMPSSADIVHESPDDIVQLSMHVLL